MGVLVAAGWGLRPGGIVHVKDYNRATGAVTHRATIVDGGAGDTDGRRNGQIAYNGAPNAQTYVQIDNDRRPGDTDAFWRVNQDVRGHARPPKKSIVLSIDHRDGLVDGQSLITLKELGGKAVLSSKRDNDGRFDLDALTGNNKWARIVDKGWRGIIEIRNGASIRSLYWDGTNAVPFVKAHPRPPTGHVIEYKSGNAWRVVTSNSQWYPGAAVQFRVREIGGVRGVATFAPTVAWGRAATLTSDGRGMTLTVSATGQITAAKAPPSLRDVVHAQAGNLIAISAGDFRSSVTVSNATARLGTTFVSRMMLSGFAVSAPASIKGQLIALSQKVTAPMTLNTLVTQLRGEGIEAREDRRDAFNSARDRLFAATDASKIPSIYPANSAETIDTMNRELSNAVFSASEIQQLWADAQREQAWFAATSTDTTADRNFLTRTASDLTELLNRVSTYVTAYSGRLAGLRDMFKQRRSEEARDKQAALITTFMAALAGLGSIGFIIGNSFALAGRTAQGLMWQGLTTGNRNTIAGWPLMGSFTLLGNNANISTQAGKLMAEIDKARGSFAADFGQRFASERQTYEGFMESLKTFIGEVGTTIDFIYKNDPAFKRLNGPETRGGPNTGPDGVKRGDAATPTRSDAVYAYWSMRTAGGPRTPLRHYWFVRNVVP